MKNHKILNLIKDFDPKGHHYKNNSLARSFAWWWTAQCLLQEYSFLEKFEDKTTKNIVLFNPNDEVYNIVLDLCWTASASGILNWFKAHKTRRQRQLIRAYMLHPRARIIGG